MGDGYRDRYEYSLDSRQLGIVLLAVAALAALVFVLGVSVGIQWQKRTSSVEEAGAPEQPVSAAGEPEPGMPVAPAVEPGYAPDNDNTAESSGEKKEVAEKDGANVSAMEAEKLTFPETLTSKEPAAPKPKSKEPKAAPKTAAEKPGAGVYTVQVGAFKESGSAKRLVDRLKKDGYKAEYVRSEGPNGLYRVRVGSFASLADARNMAAKLESKEGLKPYVTSY